MSAHTPGPWTVIQLPSGQYRIDAKAGPLHVCPAIAHGLSDARLIAATPDMHAVLRILADPDPHPLLVVHAAQRRGREILRAVEGATDTAHHIVSQGN